MKGIIIYYSYSGNTKLIADYLSKKYGFDEVMLKPQKDYTNDYDALVNEEEKKMHDKELVPIENININLNDYDIVVLGSPVWWYHIHGTLRTFLNNYNLDDKKVYAYATNGGWVGDAKKDYEEYVKLINFLDIPFKGKEIQIKKEVLDNWIEVKNGKE